MTKKQIRTLALERRDQMPDNDRRRADEVIRIRVIEKVNRSSVKNILIYCSYLTETDTGILISRLVQMEKKVYCPRVTDPQMRKMDFFRVLSDSDLKEGFHGIYEPVTDEVYPAERYGYDDIQTGKHADRHRNTLMIIPGVAFNHSCDRIGYAGGYYDRYIPRVPGAGLIGICYEQQVFDMPFPVEETDRRVQAVYTQDNVYMSAADALAE